LPDGSLKFFTAIFCRKNFSAAFLEGFCRFSRPHRRSPQVFLKSVFYIGNSFGGGL
jgi:hypothetical protein